MGPTGLSEGWHSADGMQETPKSLVTRMWSSFSRIANTPHPADRVLLLQRSLKDSSALAQNLRASHSSALLAAAQRVGVLLGDLLHWDVQATEAYIQGETAGTSADVVKDLVKRDLDWIMSQLRES